MTKKSTKTNASGVGVMDAIGGYYAGTEDGDDEAWSEDDSTYKPLITTVDVISLEEHEIKYKGESWVSRLKNYTLYLKNLWRGRGA